MRASARRSCGRRSPRNVADREAQFLIAYLPIELAARTAAEQQAAARDLCEHHGNRAREFRNGLGLAVPSSDQVEILRRAVRYLLAVERVRDKWREHNLTDAQKSQLKEREATERAAAESALLKLYGEIRLPETDNGSLSLDTVGMGGRPLQTTLDEKKRALIHQRLMELLTTVQRRVFGAVAPGKIVDLFRLGEGSSAEPGIATGKVVAGFFSFFGFPRLLSGDVVRKAIARGVETGLFAYTTGRPELGDDGRYRLDWNRIAFERVVADDEIDLDSGFLIVPSALPAKPRTTTDHPDRVEDDAGGYSGTTGEGEVREDNGAGDEQPPVSGGSHDLTVSFVADRDNLYAAWSALANLADIAGKVSVNVTATSEAGLDKAKLENGVLEPLRELGLIDD